MRKHQPQRKAPFTLGRVDESRWQPEPSLNGPRNCPEYAVWTLGGSRTRARKLVAR